MPHDWYNRHLKGVQAALTKARSAPQEKAISCTLAKMKDGEFLLCTHVNAASAGALVREAKSQGGKVHAAGTLYRAEKGVTFAVTDGKVAVRKQFSEAAMTATGKAMTVICLAVDDSNATPPSANLDELAKPFKSRVKTLIANLPKAAKTVQQKLRPLLLQALALGQETRYADAEPLLKQVEDGLAAAPKGSAAGKEQTEAADTKPVATLAIWQEAKEVVGGQLSAIQKKLRQTGDPQFQRIAEYGLNGITKRLQVGLVVALRELDTAQADGKEQARSKARSLVAEYQQFLSSDKAVRLLDENPFGVAVAIRTTLGKALQSVNQALGV